MQQWSRFKTFDLKIQYTKHCSKISSLMLLLMYKKVKKDYYKISNKSTLKHTMHAHAYKKQNTIYNIESNAPHSSL